MVSVVVIVPSFFPHVATSRTSAAISDHRRGLVMRPTFNTWPMNH
jgi:hypothetical protein